MKSWKGTSCRKMVRRFELELAAALEGRPIDCNSNDLPLGACPRTRGEINADITLWRSRLAGPELPKDPTVECPTCRQCGAKLRPLFSKKYVRVDTHEGFHSVEQPDKLLGFGYTARGHFCSLRCGWRFAIDTIEATP